uniref:Uncharacterized protein n=1 Tax=Macrostomum lignano TaxID=282301 RepID=A0A1I8HN66_9PLAT
MIDSRSFADGAGYGEDGGAARFEPMPPSSAGSLKNSVRIPRARLAGPEFGNMYQQEREESGASIDGSMNFDQQPNSQLQLSVQALLRFNIPQRRSGTFQG